MKKIISLITSRTLWITILSFSTFAVPASIHGFILRKQGLSSEQYEWVAVLVFLTALVINLIIARKLFSFKEVGLQRKAFVRSFIYSFLFVVVLRFAPDLIYGETISKEASSQLTFFSLVLLALVPFYEELLFRGIIFRVWEKSRGFIAAMLVSTILFGLEHLIYPFWGFGEWSMYTFLNPVIFGPIFILVAYRTGNIWGLSLSHFLYNASVRLTNGSTPTGDSPESYFIALLGFTLFLPILIDSIDHRLFKAEQSKINWHKFFSWLFIIIFLVMLINSVLNDFG
ncbi:MAG: putative metal-dependent membrane protease, CAAX family [Parcubacteria group bacterium GW2011_GWA2_42_28]|nr:MAG: putative metal-dependent membrane protease, CAAX family [Parcubacteria group bacterium GW2011_GWA2_42_28]